MKLLRLRLGALASVLLFFGLCVPPTVYGLVKTSFQTTPMVSTHLTHAQRVAFAKHSPAALGGGLLAGNSGQTTGGGESQPAAAGGQSSGKTSGSGNAPQGGYYPNGTPTRVVDPAAGPKTLVFSPSALTLGSHMETGYSFTVAAANGQKLALPDVSQVYGAYFTIPSGAPGAPTLRPSWEIVVNRNSTDASGPRSVAVTAHDLYGNTYTGTMTLQLTPLPYFLPSKQGEPTVVNDGSYITYTVHATVTPYNSPGATTLHVALGADLGCDVAHSNSALDVPYSGGPQTFTLSCAMSSPRPSGQGFFLTFYVSSPDYPGGQLSYTVFTP